MMHNKNKLPQIFVGCILCVLLITLLSHGDAYPQNNIASETKPKTLVMWKFRSNKEDYVLYRWIKQWNEENPNLQVDLELIPFNDYLTNKLPTAFATGSAPDIYMVSAGSFLKYAKAGFMLPLDAYIDDDLKKDLNSQSLEMATYQQHICGIPIEQEPLALFYNKKEFQKHDLEPPATWDELIACAKALNTEKMSGICLPNQRSDYQNFIFYSFLSQVTQGKKGGKDELLQFSDSGASTLKLWRELSKFNYSQETNIEIPSDIYPFATEKTAMQVCGFWAVGMLEKYYSDLEYGVVPVPSPDGKNFSSVYGGWYQVVNSQSSLAKEAAEFTLWMWGKDASRPFEWCTQASTKVPTRKSVIDQNKDFFYNGINRFFILNVLPQGTPEPRYPAEISNSISDALFQATYSDLDVNKIAQSSQKRFNQYISQNKQMFN